MEAQETTGGGIIVFIDINACTAFFSVAHFLMYRVYAMEIL